MLASALRTRAALAHFSTAELAVVRLFCAERTMSRALAIGLSWMGNGWIYLALIPLHASWLACGTRCRRCRHQHGAFAFALSEDQEMDLSAQTFPSRRPAATSAADAG